MQDLNDLNYFAQVVDYGGFASAARTLGIPKSRLSRRVAGLEERLGVRLLHRSTRRVTVTEIGRAFYTHCKAMIVEAEAAQDAIDLRRAEPCGIVRMTCPLALLDARVADMLADFMAANPRVELHLEATNRRVDVVGEGIDVAIRVRPPPIEDSDLAMRTLADRGQCLLASPGLIEGLGRPEVPADLTGYPSLGLGGPEQHHIWLLNGPRGAEARIEHYPRYISRGMFALRAAAVAGVGIVQLPTMMVTEQLQKGELIHVLPDWAPRREIIHAVFPSTRGLLPSVRGLIDFLAERFEALDED